MRPPHPHLPSSPLFTTIRCLILTAALGAAACSGDGPNLLGTPQQATFEAACNEALAEVRAENGWEDAEIVAIEREEEDGIDVWGVELDNGVEIEFASDENCRVLEIEHEEDGEDDDDDDEGDDD